MNDTSVAQGLGAVLSGEALALEQLWWGPGVLRLLGSLAVVVILQAILRSLVRRWAMHPGRRDLGLVFELVIRVLAWGTGAALVLRRVAQVAPTIAAAGAVLVAFGLAFGLGIRAQTWLLGWALLLGGRVRVGDHLEVGGIQGVVERLGLLRVLLRTDEGARVVMPTRALTERAVTLSAPDQTVPVDLRLVFDSPLDARSLQRARVLASLCPYRSWHVDPIVTTEGPRELRVRLQTWSTDAASAAEGFLRDALTSSS